MSVLNEYIPMFIMEEIERLTKTTKEIKLESFNRTLKCVNYNSENGITFDDLSNNPVITMEILEDHIDEPWDWQWMTRNPNVTIEFIEKHTDKPWDWRYMIQQKTLSMKILETLDAEYEHLLDWFELSANPNITIEYIKTHIDKPWNWNKISTHTKIENVEKYLTDFPWVWLCISMNENVTMQFVDAHPEYPWNWHWLSNNHNLTLKYIEKHDRLPYLWDWNLIQNHIFVREEIDSKEKHSMSLFI